MKENRLHEGLYLFFYTLLLLSLLSILPGASLGDFRLKEINLISDISKTILPPPVKVDSVVKENPVPIKRNSRCPKGIVCLEDYSTDNKGLQPFVQKLKRHKSEPVRIAFFGDSFIEGDILTGPLRDTLQKLFDGRGQGFMPVYSEVAKFRTTIKHEFEQLQQKSIIGKYTTEPMFGPAGQMTRALQDNWISYSPGKNQKKLERLSLLYSNPNGGTVHITLNDTIERELNLVPEPLLGRLLLTEAGATSIRLNFNSADSTNLYGVIAEGSSGVYVDNLAMRGNSGLALTRIQSKIFARLKSIRPYHLIVLQFGLNVVAEQDSTDYSWYVAGMKNVINHFREAFPESSVLVVGISDRSINTDGGFKTMPAVMRMRNAQRRIAEKTGVLFWDTFEAMGGENSMVKLAAAQPPLAGKDHTHLNARGGQMLAGKLAKALLFEIKQYEDSRTAH